jgi:hypothetical protein
VGAVVGAELDEVGAAEAVPELAGARVKAIDVQVRPGCDRHPLLPVGGTVAGPGEAEIRIDRCG